MCECGVCALPLPTLESLHPPVPFSSTPEFPRLPFASPSAFPPSFSLGASFSLLIPSVPLGRVERRKCDDALSLNAFNVWPRVCGRTWGTLNTSDDELGTALARLSMGFCHLFRLLLRPPFTYSCTRARARKILTLDLWLVHDTHEIAFCFRSKTCMFLSNINYFHEG